MKWLASHKVSLSCTGMYFSAHLSPSYPLNQYNPALIKAEVYYAQGLLGTALFWTLYNVQTNLVFGNPVTGASNFRINK